MPATLALPVSSVKISKVEPKGLKVNADAYQLMPTLSEAEMADLKADIKANGIQTPLEVLADGTVIDGHHRAQIAQELKLDVVPVIVRSFKSDDEAKAHIFRANLMRRHLNRQQKTSLVKQYLLLNSEKSDRQVADDLKGAVTDKTVGKTRKALESEGKIKQTTKRVGRDNKARPAGTTRKPVNPERMEKERVANLARIVRTGLLEAGAKLDKGVTAEAFVATLTEKQRDEVTSAISAYLPFLVTVQSMLAAPASNGTAAKAPAASKTSTRRAAAAAAADEPF